MWVRLFRLTDQRWVDICQVSHGCHTSVLSSPTLFYHSNNIQRRVDLWRSCNIPNPPIIMIHLFRSQNNHFSLLITSCSISSDFISSVSPIFACSIYMTFNFVPQAVIFSFIFLTLIFWRIFCVTIYEATELKHFHFSGLYTSILVDISFPTSRNYPTICLTNILFNIKHLHK